MSEVQDTQPNGGGHLRFFLFLFFFGQPAALLLGLINGYLAFGALALIWLACLYVIILGVPGFYRAAKCRRCFSEIKLHHADAGGDCPGCKTRVVLRDGRFYYQ